VPTDVGSEGENKEVGYDAWRKEGARVYSVDRRYTVGVKGKK